MEEISSRSFLYRSLNAAILSVELVIVEELVDTSAEQVEVSLRVSTTAVASSCLMGSFCSGISFKVSVSLDFIGASSKVSTLVFAISLGAGFFSATHAIDRSASDFKADFSILAGASLRYTGLDCAVSNLAVVFFSNLGSGVVVTGFGRITGLGAGGVRRFTGFGAGGGVRFTGLITGGSGRFTGLVTGGGVAITGSGFFAGVVGHTGVCQVLGGVLTSGATSAGLTTCCCTAGAIWGIVFVSFVPLSSLEMNANTVRNPKSQGSIVVQPVDSTWRTTVTLAVPGRHANVNRRATNATRPYRV